MRYYWFSLLTVCLLAFAACHGNSSGLLEHGASNAGLQVAALGDSDVQMAQSIHNIEKAGAHPVYVTLRAPQRSYDISPYTQILLSGGVVIVRTSKIRVFRQDDVTIYYDGSPVDFGTLPVTTAFFIDRLASTHQPGAFGKGDIAKKQSICPDCVVLIGNSRNVRKAAAHWNGLLDPWQQSPTYVAWAPTAPPSSGIAPLSNVKPHSCLLACGGGGTYCGPGWYQDGWYGCMPYYSYPSYSSYPVYDPPTCNPSLSNFSRQRRTESVLPGRKLMTQDELAEVQRQAFAHVIPDSAIDENIDPQIQGADREAIRRAMLSLPSFARGNVEVEDAQGHYYTNRAANYAAHARLHPWRYLGSGLWEDPHGENAARPELHAAANDPTANSAIQKMTDSPCPPSGGETTGAYVRDYACNSTADFNTASVDASLVSGDPGPSDGWCLSPGETGYLIVSSYSADGTTDIDAGLQWSSFSHVYEMFVSAAGSGPSRSFAPGAFSMTLGSEGGNWYFYVYAYNGADGGTYLKENTPVSRGVGPWTFERCTCLAQQIRYDDGSYWGYNLYGNSIGPLFNWSYESPSSGHSDVAPNPWEAVRIGSKQGIYLW